MSKPLKLDSERSFFLNKKLKLYIKSNKYTPLLYLFLNGIIFILIPFNLYSVLIYLFTSVITTILYRKNHKSSIYELKKIITEIEIKSEQINITLLLGETVVLPKKIEFFIIKKKIITQVYNIIVISFNEKNYYILEDYFNENLIMSLTHK